MPTVVRLGWRGWPFKWIFMPFARVAFALGMSYETGLRLSRKFTDCFCLIVKVSKD